VTGLAMRLAPESLCTKTLLNSKSGYGCFLGILGKWSLIQKTFAALLVFVSDKGGAHFF